MRGDRGQARSYLQQGKQNVSHTAENTGYISNVQVPPTDITEDLNGNSYNSVKLHYSRRISWMGSHTRRTEKSIQNLGFYKCVI
jgi:hypothetical protein